MKAKYKIELFSDGLISTFIVDNPNPTIKAWAKRHILNVTEPNGDLYSYDLSKYHIMTIKKVKNGI